MYVTRLEIANVRGFPDKEARTSLRFADGGSGWHVVAGRNGTGKSTLLRALALAIAGPEQARALMPSFAGWVQEGRKAAQVLVELCRSAEDGFQGIDAPPEGPLMGGLIWHPQEGSEPALRPTRARKNPFWHGPWSASARGWFVAGYGPSRRIGGQVPEAQGLMATGLPRRLTSLFREDASLAPALDWLQRLKFRTLENDRGAKKLLRHVVALLNDLLPGQKKVIKVDAAGIWVTRGRRTVELRALGDGLSTLFALVVDIVRHMHDAYGKVRFQSRRRRVAVSMPGVVLIDEPELHLHPSLQQRIGFWLSERFPRVQFLVATHSSLICQAAVSAGMFRAWATATKRVVKPVDVETYNLVVHGTPEDALLSRLFGMKETRSERAEELRDEWSHLRAILARRPLQAAEHARFVALSRLLAFPFDFEEE